MSCFTFPHKSMVRQDFNICDAESCHHCTKVRQKWRDITPDPLPKVPKLWDPVEGSAGLEGHFFTYLESIDACRELPGESHL